MARRLILSLGVSLLILALYVLGVLALCYLR